MKHLDVLQLADASEAVGTASGVNRFPTESFARLERSPTTGILRLDLRDGGSLSFRVAPSGDDSEDTENIGERIAKGLRALVTPARLMPPRLS